MSILDTFVNRIAGSVLDGLEVRTEDKQGVEYYKGAQKHQLRVIHGKTDDNVILNFVGLAVDRSVSKLLHGGIDFKLPEGEEAQAEYLNDLWDVNKKENLLLQLALNAAIYGTAAIKIIPDGKVNLFTGVSYPRLVAVCPEYLRIITNPQDIEDVDQYIIEYRIGDISYREITRQAQNLTDLESESAEASWIVENYLSSYQTKNKWMLVSTVQFPYDFPPILHWKNLPSINDVYGTSDIANIIGIQDKTNFIASNIAKIIRLHAHPQIWGRNISGNLEQVELGPDKVIKVQGDTAGLFNLEMSSDLGSSRTFFTDLRQSLFDVVREIDITSITDRIGSLTNFGLRVLNGDALAKNDTKRQLMGDALLELNRRLLVIGGYTDERSRPGQIIWHDPLPVDEISRLSAQQIELSMGTVSKQTIAEENGRNWEEENKRILDEQAASGNLGGALLTSPTMELTKAFTRTMPKAKAG